MDVWELSRCELDKAFLLDLSCLLEPAVINSVKSGLLTEEEEDVPTKTVVEY